MPTSEKADILERLDAACDGHPHAKIPWPHDVLHDARDEIERLRAHLAAQINYMVQRFLGWRLPEDFNPDGGISFKKMFNEHTAHPMKSEPTGTNLFDVTQATAMVHNMVEGMEPQFSTDWEREEHRKERAAARHRRNANKALVVLNEIREIVKSDHVHEVRIKLITQVFDKLDEESGDTPADFANRK